MAKHVLRRLLTGALMLLVGLLTGCQAASVSAEYTQAHVTEQDAAAKYPDFAAIATPLLCIPGLAQDAIPQGIDYAASPDWVVISNYHRDGAASTLSLVDKTTGEMVKAVRLANVDGSVHTSHVGGVAIAGDLVWVASQSKLFEVSIAALEAAEHMGTVRIEREIAVSTKASYANVSGNVLWVGEFFHTDNGYETPETHHLDAPDGKKHKALCVGYRLDENGAAAFTLDKDGIARPDYALSTIDRIQGFAQAADGVFYLSQSYGRRNDATLYAYANVLEAPADDSILLGEWDVPLWYLDTGALLSILTTPPMSEGITVVGDALLVLYESGANYYRTGGALSPTDSVWALRISGFPAR